MFRSEVFEDAELSCAARMVKAAGHWRVGNQGENAAAAGSRAEGLGVPRRNLRLTEGPLPEIALGHHPACCHSLYSACQRFFPRATLLAKNGACLPTTRSGPARGYSPRR